MRDYRFLIDGELRSSQSGRTTAIENPATGEIIANVPEGDERDAELAVQAAHEAFPEWRKLAIAERGELCLRLAERLLDCQQELGLLESLNTGSCIGPMTKDVGTAVESLRYFAALGSELKGMSVPASTRGLHLTVREPYGVFVAITAFNHPLMFAASKLGAALVAGNTVVIKPPAQAPLTNLVLGELAYDLFPPGVLNIVHSSDATVGAALVSDARTRRISVTGSVGTGKAVMRAAAENLAEVSLELGGKNPLIVFPDADPDLAAAGAVRAMNFGWQGQSCGSTSRVLVHADIHERFLERLTHHVGNLVIGPPQDPATQVGALISKQQFEKVVSYIQIGIEEGARLLLGGGCPTGPQFKKGYFVEPTVFVDVQPTMRIAAEEIFGPVMSVLSWTDEASAIDIANGSDFGLTANVYTNDLATVLRVVPQLEAGFVWVNGLGEHFRGLPYGGNKQSGIGREEALEQLLACTQSKSISLLPLQP